MGCHPEQGSMPIPLTEPPLGKNNAAVGEEARGGFCGREVGFDLTCPVFECARVAPDA